MLSPKLSFRAVVVCLSLAAAGGIDPAAAAAADDERLMQLLDRAYDARVALSPQTLTSLGSREAYDRLNDYTDEAARKELELGESQLKEMKSSFDVTALGKSARLSYRLFEFNVEQDRITYRWRMHRFPVSTMFSPTGSIPAFLINEHRVQSEADALAYVGRLRDVERVMREVAVSLETRAGMGIVAPRFTFEPVRQDARKVISGAPFDAGADSALFADFKKKLAALDVPAATKERLLAQARDALIGPFKRGYEHLLTTLSSIEPKAQGNDGAWSLPDGGAYYADAIRLYTTTDLSPEQIHRTGLDEVKRIQAEMEIVKQRVGFEGSLTDFFAFVKSSPRFHYPNTDEGRQAYLQDATHAIDQAMARAPTVFHRLPRAKVEVRAVEPWRQNTAPAAFYNRPPMDGSRPGLYYVNLADMRQVLEPQVEVYAYHEGVPGHHFQVAFAQEQTNLPKFRRRANYSVFQEGWGLYAEQLSKELGLYDDPYADFGRLSVELWRAIRLVTDSGLHYKHWSREQAIEYFRRNTLLSDRDIAMEVERYIVDPGQATSYKVGQMEILRLRARAQARLGAKFDLRDFHEVVLGNGALPLQLLGEQVDGYTAR